MRSTGGLIRRQLLIAVIGASTLAGFASSSGSATAQRIASCQALPAAVQGSYRRSDDYLWRLVLGDCTFRVTNTGSFVGGGGDYTLTSGDATNGQIVLSNDRGCRESTHPGQKDEPTPYTYSFDGMRLTLQVVGGNDADLCTVRSGNTARTWLKAPNGSVRIEFSAGTARKSSGAFTMSGAGTDKGRAVVTRSVDKKDAVHLSASLRGGYGTLSVSVTLVKHRPGKWEINPGSARGSRLYRLYTQATGGGKAVATTHGTRVSVVLTGTITS